MSSQRNLMKTRLVCIRRVHFLKRCKQTHLRRRVIKNSSGCTSWRSESSSKPWSATLKSPRNWGSNWKESQYWWRRWAACSSISRRVRWASHMTRSWKGTRKARNIISRLKSKSHRSESTTQLCRRCTRGNWTHNWQRVPPPHTTFSDRRPKTSSAADYTFANSKVPYSKNSGAMPTKPSSSSTWS